jgi:hypothetical protein
VLPVLFPLVVFLLVAGLFALFAFLVFDLFFARFNEDLAFARLALFMLAPLWWAVAGLTLDSPRSNRVWAELITHLVRGRAISPLSISLVERRRRAHWYRPGTTDSLRARKAKVGAHQINPVVTQSKIGTRALDRFYPREFDFRRGRCRGARRPQPVRLLRMCCNRPCRSHGSKQADEAACPHSITSSARASTLVGISRPIALAVVTLTTNSNWSVVHREFALLRPEQDLVDVVGSARELARKVWHIGHQTAGLNVLPMRVVGDLQIKSAFWMRCPGRSVLCNIATIGVAAASADGDGRP